MGSLSEKVAIVTGASNGIGRAIAERLGEDGAIVVVNYNQSDEKAKQVIKDIQAKGGKAVSVQADMSQVADARRLVNETVKQFGGLDILVNNAGTIHGADFLDIAEADFDRVLRVNLKGTFLVGQAAARQMVAQVKAGKAAGAIINLSSVNAVVAIPNQVPYCVSKGGVDQLTKVMALALAPHGIRVNAIGPGSIMTEILKAVATDKEAKRRLLARTPLGRIGEPDEVASVALFLASAEAAYITGQTIYPDGGRLALNYTVPVKDEALG